MKTTAVSVFLLLLTLRLSAATNQWEAEVERFEAGDRTHPPPKAPIVFVGSSSVRYWRTITNDLAPYPVLNRGVGGSEVSDAVYFAERIVLRYRPPVVVMYAGGNDIHRGKTPAQVFSDFKDFVRKVTSALPNTTIAYISIAPNPARWSEVDRVRAANESIARYAREHPQVEFIDVFSHMLGPDGMPRPDIYAEDRLHMNERGYALWTTIIKPRLAEWVTASKQTAADPILR